MWTLVSQVRSRSTWRMSCASALSVSIDVELQIPRHRFAFALLWRLQLAHLRHPVIVIDQGAALLSAPLALAEELNGCRLVLLPHPANGVDLMAPVEHADQAGGVVVDPYLIVPWADPKYAVICMTSMPAA